VLKFPVSNFSALQLGLQNVSVTAKLIVQIFCVFFAEIDGRRLAYLCENSQEELKLESNYKKM